MTGQGGKPECLYSKIHRLYVKSKCKEEKQKNLRISVELIQSVNQVFGQSLTVQLTDDDDPFFLYGLALTEDDFKDLKHQQGLLVDFDRFPGELLRLLAECGSDGEHQSVSRFLLMLDEPENDVSYSHQQTSLQILETNNFKHLCHLCLSVSRGNDTEIKKQMAVKIKQLKEAVENGGKQLSRAQSQLEDALCRLEGKTRELEEVQRRWGDEKTDLHVSSMRELTQEREKCAMVQLESQRRLAEERARLDEQHAQAARGIEAELARLRSHADTLSDKHGQAESLNKELSGQLEQVRREARQLERDCAGLRKHNLKLDADYHDKEKEAHGLATKVAVLEQKLKEKTVLIGKQNDLLCSANHKQAWLEDKLADKDSIVQKRELEVQSLNNDLAKSNEILAKMHTELSCTKSKLKLRTTIALEQERLLDAKQKELGDACAQASELTARLADVEAEAKTLREALEITRAQLEDKTKHLRNNENVINWLNRRLNEAQSSSLQHRANAFGLAASTPLSAPPSATFPPRKPQNLPALDKPKAAEAQAVGVGADVATHKPPVKSSVFKAAVKQDSRRNQAPLLSAYFPK